MSETYNWRTHPLLDDDDGRRAPHCECCETPIRGREYAYVIIMWPYKPHAHVSHFFCSAECQAKENDDDMGRAAEDV